MNIYYYNAATPADAFDSASKDATRWSFAEMLGLGRMAEAIRSGFIPAKRPGNKWACFCECGFFLLFGPNQTKGYGISVVLLKGHETGIDDPIAQEILDFHRVHRAKECFASPLLTWSQHISSIDDLDRGYHLLEQAQLLAPTGSISKVENESGITVERNNYVCPEVA